MHLLGGVTIFTVVVTAGTIFLGIEVLISSVIFFKVDIHLSLTRIVRFCDIKQFS